MTESRTPTRRTRKDAVQNRQRIMDAAWEVFARHGFGATLDDVASCAGLGVGTVYRHFPNKSAVIDALFEQSIDRLVELARAASEVEDAWEGFVAFVVSVADLQIADRGLRDLMHTAKTGCERGEVVRERLRPVVRPLLDRARAQGALRPDFDEHDFTVMQLMLSAAYEFTSPAAPDAWRRYLYLLLDALRAHRDAPTPLPRPALDEAGIDKAMQAWPTTKRL